MELCRIFVFAIVAIGMVHSQSCHVFRKRDDSVKPCKFPFVWGDQIFFGCTNYTNTDPETPRWCSTDTDENHQHIEGGSNWGDCLEDSCPLEDGTQWDVIDNYNALKTLQLIENYREEEGKQECKCVDATECKWSNDVLRQSQQMGNHPVRKTLVDFLTEGHKLCDEECGGDGKKVRCCEKGLEGEDDSSSCPPPTEATTVPEPRSFNFNFHSNKDLGTWLPEGEDCGLRTVNTNIFGGTVAKLGDYGFAALLGYKVNGGVNYGCGGSLINKHYVLTAAHCVPPHTPEIAEIVLGEHDQASDPDCNSSECVAKKVTKNPKKIIQHPGYNGRSDGPFDMALIRLDGKVEELYDGDSQVSTITPVCLPWRENEFVYKLRPESKFKVMGWGRTESGSPSEKLLQVDVPFFDGPKCKETWRTMNTSIQICAGGEQGVAQDSCNGDSGGPLVVQKRPDQPWYQVGVVSYGTSSCGIGYPGVYTSVSGLLTWIYEQMEE